MIELTKEHEAQIPILIQEAVDAQTDEIKPDDVRRAINNVYESMGEGHPKLIILDSPIACLVAKLLWGCVENMPSKSDINSALNLTLRTIRHASWQQTKKQDDGNFLDTIIESLPNGLFPQLNAEFRDSLDTKLALEATVSIQVPDDVKDAIRKKLLEKPLKQQLANIHKEESLSSYWLYCWYVTYKFAKSIGVQFDEKTYRLFEDFSVNVKYCLPYKDIIFVSRNPVEIHWKERQLHNEKGMAVKYKDGFGWYSLNGVSVPGWLVEQKDTEIDPARIRDIQNAEIRREFVRKVGYDRIYHKLGGKVIDKKEMVIFNGEEEFPHVYELIELNVEESGQGWRFLSMLNPSLSTPDNPVMHVEGVSNDCDTFEDAWNFRKPDKMRQVPVDDENGEDYYQQGDVILWPQEAKSLKMYPKVLS